MVDEESVHSLRVSWPDYPDSVDLNSLFIDEQAELFGENTLQITCGPMQFELLDVKDEVGVSQTRGFERFVRIEGT